MSDKISYLEQYNEENSKVVDSYNMLKKVSLKLLIYCLCTIIYFTVTNISRKKGFLSIQTQFQDSLVSSIMYVSFGITIVSFIFYLLILVSKKFVIAFDNMKYKVKKFLFNLVDWLSVFPISATIAAICFSFLFTFSVVSGESMEHNIFDGDYVFTSFVEKIDRFDVVILFVTGEDNLEKPADYNDYYIKRVIGMPGDSLTWINGVLTINGNVVKEEFFSEDVIQSYQFGINDRFNFYGTFHYKVNDIINSTTIIPEDYYFVMGDNRCNSTDSRIIGLIPKKNIAGVVKCRITESGIERI